MLAILSALLAIFLFLVVFGIPIMGGKAVYNEFKKPFQYDEYYRIFDPNTGKVGAATKGYLRQHNLTLEQYEAEFFRTHEPRNPSPDVISNPENAHLLNKTNEASDQQQKSAVQG